VRHSDCAAAPQQQQLDSPGLDFQHRLQIERFALVFIPNALRHDHVSGRRVTQFALDAGSIAVEVKEQRCRIVAKAVKIERLVASDRAVDLRRRALK